MLTTTADVEDFVDKVRSEGGLAEYLLGYGGKGVPEEISTSAERFVAAWNNLWMDFCVLLEQRGIESFDLQ